MSYLPCHMDYSSLRPPSIHLAPLQPFPRYDFGKGARIRTSIGSFGDCSPTVGRLPYVATPLFNQLAATSSVV